jgi:antitoxin (DNA-binding transcriptional repressor) of toxin-antitoxin stability system
VRRGETILIMDRRTPVARIEPVRTEDGHDDAGLMALMAEGIVVPPEQALDLESFLAEDVPRLPQGASAVRALLRDREESR